MMGTQTGPERRVFLFLQGPSSPIFAKIADRLEAKGHLCLRINLNPGDQIFWRRKGGYHYRGRGGQDWRSYIAAFLVQHGVTDLVLLGEERPYHLIAIEAAKRQDIAVAVVEMGYLRPDWLTIERDGMSSNSHFPNDPQTIIDAARTLPEPDFARRYTQSFAAEAAYDLLYNLPNVFLWFLFPHYRRHALFHPLAEYAGWVMRLAGGKKRTLVATALVDTLLSSGTAFFVFPLQLQTDFQLRSHSPYHDQREAITEVITSFAAHAPETASLVVKIHPARQWADRLASLCRGAGHQTWYWQPGAVSGWRRPECAPDENQRCRDHQFHRRVPCPATRQAREGAWNRRLRHCRSQRSVGP